MTTLLTSLSAALLAHADPAGDALAQAAGLHSHHHPAVVAIELGLAAAGVAALAWIAPALWRRARRMRQTRPQGGA